MIEFFLNVIIVTGGVFCILLWIVGFVELIDRIADSRGSKSIDIDLEG